MLSVIGPLIDDLYKAHYKLIEIFPECESDSEELTSVLDSHCEVANRLRDYLPAVESAYDKRLSDKAKAGKKRTVPSRRKTEDELASEKMQVLAALLTHHRFESEEINWEPARQRDLLLLLGADWNQSKISRALKRTFGPAPMANYKRLCRREAIEGFLKKEEGKDGSVSYEADAPYHRPFHPTDAEERLTQND